VPDVDPNADVDALRHAGFALFVHTPTSCLLPWQRLIDRSEKASRFA
jgi:hypothetical protein